jgi:hypothetical protein
MTRPDQVDYAYDIINAVQRGETELPAAIKEIATAEVNALSQDKAFRLHMVFQATLAHDPQVADALHRIDKAHVDAWTDFTERSFKKLGLKLRKGMDFPLIGCALHAAGEGVMFRALLSARPDHSRPAPEELLGLIAKAIVIASADPGDGKTLDEILSGFSGRRHESTDTSTA